MSTLNAALVDVLRKRAFGGNGGGSACHTYDDYTAEPIVGKHTFHDIMTYTSFVAMILCCIITFGLCMGHIFNYREPLIQKQLIRVILTAPAFAIFSFLGVWKYRITDYMYPIPIIYEAFAFVAVFFLLLNLLIPSGKFQDQVAYFSQRAFGKKQSAGYRLFRRWYIFILQFLPIRFISAIASEILTAANCVGGRKYKHANTIVSIVDTITGVIAIIGLFGCLRCLHSALKQRDSKIVGKLAMFKLVVLLQIVTALVLNILTHANALNPTKTLSYNDLNLGLKPFITCLEAFLISCGMIFFYDPRLHGKSADYVVSGEPGILTKEDGQALEEGMGRRVVNPKMSPFKALFDTVNMLDVVQGLANAIRLLRRKQA